MGKIGKKIVMGLMAGVFAFGYAFPASAEVTLNDLLKRIEALESENAALKSEVIGMKSQQSVAAPSSAATVSGGNFLKTGPEITLYGQLKTDLVYSDSNSGASANTQLSEYNAPREAIRLNQATYNASAQDSRLGLNFKAPDMDNGGKLTGKFEMDFAGGQPSTTYTPRLRLAYAQLDYDKWAVNAGQQWDFFTPLNASTLNTASLNRSGNLGNRHPQAFLTNKWGEVFGGKLATKVGVIDSDLWNQENSGAPVLGAYASYDTKVFGKGLVLGVGGIYGTDSNNTLTSKGTNNNTIYATTLGVTLVLADWLNVKAEGFAGAGLGSFFANNNVSLTNGSAKAIRSMGGFSEITYKPFSALETNYGIGLDYANADQVFTDRTALWKSNKTYYTNAKYSLSKDVAIGLEYQYLVTNWMDGVKGDDNRIQSSLIYKF